MNSRGVSSFYDDKGVFITGATGFLAKVLLEKVLYSCHGVKNVYILIRRQGAKTGGPINEERFQQLLKSKAFDRLRDKRPECLAKVVPVWGDVTQPGLGLSETDRETLIANASVAFHSAATVKFNAPLKVAIEINLIGTKNVFEVFQSFERKDAFVYISTAFSNCQESQIAEAVYPSPVSPQFLIESYENLDAKALDSLFESISEGRPNTYTFSKAMAELYLEENAKGLPVAIVRPSIVGGALREPSPGWYDTKSLLTNAMHAMGLGLIHCMPINGENRFDLIPVDLVCNLTLVVAWALRQNGVRSSDKKKIPVYNCVSGCDNGLSFNKIQELSMKYGDQHPSTLQVAYPFMVFSKNPVVVAFTQYYHHYLPALALDAVRTVKGKSSKYFALYRRFFASLPYQTFFVEREFHFDNANVRALIDQLESHDQKVFNFDAKRYEWEPYLTQWFNILRELYYPEENSRNDHEKAKKRVAGLYWRMIVFNSIFAAGLTATLTSFVFSPIYNAFFASDQY